MKKELWQTKKLYEICEKASSGISQNQLDNEAGEYPVYGASGFIKNISFYQRSEEYISIVKDGAGIGRLSLLPAFSSVIGTCQYLIPKEEINIKYLYYFLSGIDFWKYKNGSTIPHLYFKDYSEENVLLPSLKEQKRIVKILDEVFEKVVKAKEIAEKNLQNSRELFESYLESVFSNPRPSWVNDKLENLTTKIGSGATPRGGRESYKTEGISLIRSLNVHDCSFRLKNLAFIDTKQAEKLSNVSLEKGDVLLNITGASVARCCIVPEKVLPARVNQHVSIIRSKKEIILPEFLLLLLVSKTYKDTLLKIGEKGGSTRQAITKEQIENLMISYPKSLVEQKAIVKKLDELSGQTRKLEEIYKQKLELFEELKKSVLAKAFRGEL